MPHLVALSPFWDVFSKSDKGACRLIVLLSVPLWAKNRQIVPVYGLVDPFAVIGECKLRFE